MKKLSRNPKVKDGIEFLSLSQNLNKIQQFLFYVLILLIPTQFGLHFWPDFSFIKGVRIDYLSPTLYATDILIFLIFILTVVKFSIFNFKFSIKSKFPILLFFALCLIVGIFLSKNPMAGAYGLTKLMEFVFLGFYTAQNINKLKLKNVLLVFAIGINFESLLAIAQYLNHGSLQGIFYFFGERFFTSLTPGIANASLVGSLVLRPYGTFPHPNVLAGYLVIGMMLIIFNFKFLMRSQFSILNLKTLLLIISLILGTIGLFLTLSRIAIILWVLILGFFLIRKLIIPHFAKTSWGKHHSSLIILALVCIGSTVFFTPLGSRFTELKLTDESVVQRESLIQSSIATIKDHPIFGVGLNNFLVNLPSYQTPNVPLFYLQPVHNFFLLVLSETGIIGFGFFIWFIYKTYQSVRTKKNYFIIYPLSLILIVGMFDHYFLTLQQGQLLFSFVLGLCWSNKLKK